MYVYFGEHVDGGPLTPPVHVNLALNASAFKNMSVDVGLSGRIHPEISWSKDDAPLNMESIEVAEETSQGLKFRLKDDESKNM